MVTINTLLQQCLLAATLAFSAAGAALAGPAYHVSVDTSSLAGSTGYVDFSVVGTAGAPLSVANFSNFGGVVGAEADRFGAAFGTLQGGFMLHSAPGDNYLTYAATFGGIYSFDVSFGGEYESVSGIDGATFVVGLYDANYASYLPQASFLVQPGNDLAGPGVTPVAPFGNVTVSEVSAVPEPASWALLMLGLVMAGAVARRRPGGAGVARCDRVIAC